MKTETQYTNVLIKTDDNLYTLSEPQTKQGLYQALLNMLEEDYFRPDAINSPDQTRNYLQIKLAPLEHEVFCVLFLDSQHRVIRFEEMFRGTIDAASVYPREVVKRCLQLNAAAVIFAHNHPSGIPEPSQADIRLTAKLVDALSLIDVRVLDHIVIGGVLSISMAEQGLL
jgi:DNA repair protein RadC